LPVTIGRGEHNSVRIGHSPQDMTISRTQVCQIVLKNSKIAVLRKSRKCSALAISAAARLCRIDASASDRFCGN
jgi:hypothetical protein